MEELSRRVSSAIFGTAFYEFCIQSSISLNCYAKHLRVSVLQLICIEVTYSKQESVAVETWLDIPRYLPVPAAMDNITFIPLSSYNWDISHFNTLPWNPTVFCFTASFFAIAMWPVLDLAVLVFVTFKKYNGIYFWSILIAA
jgi:hypothetical protein